MRKIIALTAAAVMCAGLAGCSRVAVGKNANAAGYNNEDIDACLAIIEDNVGELENAVLKGLTLTEYGDSGERLEEIKKSNSREYAEYMVFDAELGPNLFTRIKAYFVVDDGGGYSEGEWCMARTENGEWEIAERRVGKNV